MASSEFLKTRRKIIKASAASMIIPSAAFAAGDEATPQQRYGILGQQAPELEVKTWIDGKGKPSSFKLADHNCWCTEYN